MTGGPVGSPPILDAPHERVVSAERGEVRCHHRRVAIVGASRRREQAPGFGGPDPEWCVWAINEIWQPRYDRHFELHPLSKPPQDDRELKFLRECRAPCYVLALDPEVVPAGVRYPLERLRAAGLRNDYFTCTFAYQIALAIVDGFEEIGLFGLRLWEGSPRERLLEQPCVNYWIGVAEGRGVRVTDASRLTDAPFRYGYDYDPELQYGKVVVESARAAIHYFDRRDRGVVWTPLQSLPKPRS